MREYVARAAAHPGMADIHVGTVAPTPAVTLDDGALVDLARVYDRGPTLVYFYPKSGTPGCTRQACNLRDHFADLVAKGVQVLGVSKDKLSSQARFRSRQRLPYRLVTDRNGFLGGFFGVPARSGNGYARRSFLVVKGRVAWIQKKAKPDSQAADVLGALEGFRN